MLVGAALLTAAITLGWQMGPVGVFDAAAWLAGGASALTLGIAGCVHLVALRRMQRVKRHDGAIAVVGIAAVAAFATAIAVAAAGSSRVATAILHAGWLLWMPGIAFVGYLLHALSTRGERVEPATIVVLGGALRGRHVGPLLRRRVERAAALWREAADPAIRIVVAGGQGNDEPRSEAAAMAEHLVEECGIPAAVIDLEDASTSTAENLAFTRRVVRAREPWLVVTSEYHVPRTRTLLRSLGITGDVAGSWSSPVYRPGALVRELAATVVASRATRISLVVSSLVVAAAGLVRALSQLV